VQIEKTELYPKDCARSRFTTGNKKSLVEDPAKIDGIDIRESLMKYHNEWYSSNIMSLCVVGNNTLNELQDFVEKHFSSVIDKGVRLKDYSEDPMMDNNTLGHIVKYVPVKKSTMLSIKWPKLPSVKEFWEGSPLTYLGHLIGDEGKGSLLSYLIK
jgi:insulysin